MTYLVTGAAGFIGSYVVRQLVDEGETVVAFDRQWPGTLLRIGVDPGRFSFVTGDVTDFAHLARVVTDHGVSRVIHLAGELHARSADNPGQCIASNVVGTHNALELGRVLGVQRVVTASSAAVFGPPDRHPPGPIPNDARTYAGDVYEASKIFNEAEGEFYFRRFGVDNVAIRVGLAFGFGCQIGSAAMMIDELVGKPLRGEPGRPPWGRSVLNWTYSYDAADAFVRASRATTTETFAYNLKGDPRTIAEAAEIARRLVPGADIEPVDEEHRWSQVFDDSVIRRELGFEPKWSFADGLADTVERLRSEAAGS